MKIFYPNASIHYPPKDGPHTHQFQLIKNLVELGHEVVTLEPDKNPFTRTRRKTPFSVLGAVRWADALYCRTNEGLNIATRLTAPLLRAAIPKRCAVVWQMDLGLDLSVASSKRSRERIFRDIRVLRRRAARVNAAIGVTNSIAQQARSLLGIEHCYTIPNGSDPSLFRPDIDPVAGLGRRSDKLRVGWIGSHSNAIHDTELIAELSRLIDEKRLPIEVHAIGRTEGMFAKPHPRCLTIHGPVSYFDLPRYLAGLDAGLVLYNIRYDGGSPLKLFDYLASGCVAICTPGDSIEEILRGEEAGYVEQWTAQSLADRLLALRSDGALLDRIGVNGRRLIEQKHNWSKIAQETACIIQQAIERQRP